MRYFPEYFPDYREVLDPAIRWIDRTILTLAFLAFTKKQAKKASGKNQAQKAIKNKDKILSYIENNEGASSSELSEILNLNSASVRVLLSELTEKGQIVPQRNGRSRRYALKRSFS